MNTPPEPKTLERRAFRSQHSDGLAEIFLGPTLLIGALVVVQPAFTALVIVPILVFAPLLTRLQARYIHPRIGYARLPVEDNRANARGVLLYVLGVFGLFVVALAWMGDLAEVEAWRRWAPALAGMLCSGGFLCLAQRSGLVRHFVYVGIVLAGGLACSFLPVDPPYQNVALFLTSLAVLMTCTGIVLFVHFLRTHPVRSPETDHGAR